MCVLHILLTRLPWSDHPNIIVEDVWRCLYAALSRFLSLLFSFGSHITFSSTDYLLYPYTQFHTFFNSQHCLLLSRWAWFMFSTSLWVLVHWRCLQCLKELAGHLDFASFVCRQLLGKQCINHSSPRWLDFKKKTRMHFGSNSEWEPKHITVCY